MDGGDKSSLLIDKLKRVLEEDHLSENAIKNAISNYSRFILGENGIISKSNIKPAEGVLNYSDLENFYGYGEKALSQVAIINLNGGLGTSMGLSSAKSLLKIKGGETFLSIIVKQVSFFRKKYNVALPLLFMNSFNTDKDTLASLGSFKNENQLPLSFLQNKIRKIDIATLLPVDHPEDRSLEWCPPGHGDIYEAMYQNGIIKKLLDNGIEYAFISNVDNLGAEIDLNILGYLAKTEIPFLMEVTERTEADRKGGHLARNKKNNRLILRELAQCPENEKDEGGDFQNIKKYCYFNTNSLWLNLRALQELLDELDGIVYLPLIVNKKNVNPRDENSTPVYQLETAMGTAISLFDKSVAVCVPRSRFAPVKSTNDLIVLRSDRYDVDSDGTVKIKPDAKGGAGISVKLSKHYKKIDDFEARFPAGVPSMIDCESLIIDGDFLFGANVKFVGNVHLINKSDKQVQIPADTICEGKKEY